jgi:hypothetical protein
VEAQAQALQNRERIHEIRARIERNEHIKKQEVEEFARALKFQGVLKDLSLRNELDRRRTDEEMQRFQALYDKLGQDETKALVFMLDDERLKADLLRELIRRDMTPEQLAVARVEELEQRLEERFEQFSEHVSQRQGERSRRIAEGGTRTRRLLLAVGKQVVAYDPASATEPEAPREAYDLSAGGLGWVRSARAMVTRDGPTVVAGAQLGVYLFAEGAAGAPRELRLPERPRGRGGVNAAAYFDGYVYATHSELGLVRWDQHGVRGAEPLFPEVTGRNDATRGVYVTPMGKLYFSSGPDVYRHDLLHRERALVRFRGTGGSVTGFLTTKHEVFAGTRGGRVLRWSMDDPGSPRELNVRKASPIYMLRVAELEGTQHLMVGAKEHGVTAVALEDGRAIDFRAPDQIRWVDGASDLVFGGPGSVGGEGADGGRRVAHAEDPRPRKPDRVLRRGHGGDRLVPLGQARRRAPARPGCLPAGAGRARRGGLRRQAPAAR